MVAEHLVPTLLRGLQHVAPAGGGDAGVIYQHIQPLVVVERLRHEHLAVGRLPHVPLESDRFTTGGADLCDKATGWFRATEIVDDHRMPLARELAGNCGPNPTR